MERPRFNNVGRWLTIGGLLFNTACISAVNTEPKPISQPPVPTATPARFWEGSRLPLVSEGQFTTRRGRTYWSNFTTTPFDPESAERMLQTFEYFAQRRFLAMSVFDLRDLRLNEIVSVQTWPEPPTDLVLNLIPDNAPLPEWATNRKIGWGVRPLGVGRSEAFVRITGQDSDNLELGRVFCQSRLIVEVSPPQVLIFTSDQLSILLGEPACNGYNFAVAARRRNTWYESYQQTAGGALIFTLTLAYQLPVLLKQDYWAIPQKTGAIGPRFGKPPTLAQRYFFWG